MSMASCFKKIRKVFKKEFEKKGVDLGGRWGKSFRIASTNFPKEIQDKYGENECVYLGITHKGSAPLIFFKDLTGKNLTSASKEELKVTAKAFAKAVSKYLDKCNNGYIPDSDTLSHDFHDKVQKKALKYMKKGLDKLNNKEEDLTKEDDNNRDEDDERELDL